MPLHEVPWAPLAATPHRAASSSPTTPRSIRSGIVRLLADEGFDVVGEAGDAEELLALVDRVRPDLVITDIRMPPDADRRRPARRGRRSAPSTPTSPCSCSRNTSRRARPRACSTTTRAGVGYLLKERVGELDEFVAACRTVAAGGRVVDPMVARAARAERSPRATRSSG